MVIKNVLFLSLIIIFSLSTVYAQQEDIRFYHPKDTNLTIYEKCRVNGVICDSSYECNLTVLSPLQNIIIDNVEMLGDSVYRNFTMTEENQSSNGIYESTIDCSNSSLSGSNTFFYKVTPNGSEPIDEGQGLILLGSIFFLIVMSCCIGFMGIKSTNTTVSLSLVSFSTLIMVFSLGLILNILELSLGTFSDITNNYSTIYVLFMILMVAGAIGLITYIIVVALNFYWRLRGMKDEFSVK